MLTHLRENSADVEVDITWVRDLQALIDGLFTEVQIVVLDFKSLFKVG